jgi:hypothetical protein
MGRVRGSFDFLSSACDALEASSEEFDRAKALEQRHRIKTRRMDETIRKDWNRGIRKSTPSDAL